jgi:electron transfer flavoprotein alpha subunit
MSILVVAEMREGELRNASLSAVSAAKALSALVGAPFDILLLGRGAVKTLPMLKNLGAATVLFSEAPAVAQYTAEAHGLAAAQLVRARGYKYALAAATSFGKDLMPRLAGLLNAGMVSEAVGFEKSGEALVYRRFLYAGNAVAKVAVDTPVAVLTVRETAFAAAEPSGPEANVVDAGVSVDPQTLHARFVEYRLTKSDRPSLTAAPVVVGAGRGVKDAAGLKLVEGLADALGAALGGTRAVVDEGLLPNDLQIGQTGRIVAPDLYIACGVSGAIQHVAGIKDAKVIVAVNKDPQAPIFEIADYGLVADLSQALPELTEKIRSLRS